MTLFQVFPYWDEHCTRAMAIDTFGKSIILRSPAEPPLPSSSGASLLPFPARLQHRLLRKS